MSIEWVCFFLGQISVVGLYGYIKLMAWLDRDPFEGN